MYALDVFCIWVTLKNKIIIAISRYGNVCGSIMNDVPVLKGVSVNVDSLPICSFFNVISPYFHFNIVSR